MESIANQRIMKSYASHPMEFSNPTAKIREKTETIWSQRRSIAENNYAYRLEENDIEDEAETEIMIEI